MTCLFDPVASGHPYLGFSGTHPRTKKGTGNPPYALKALRDNHSPPIMPRQSRAAADDAARPTPPAGHHWML
ncbi:hypothetical protein N7539_001924 [Penicillium diatomitis]|uniref:Uncharacterized protein n=1 Tax=Penicillium diatomitis TaxID=2819901 RepID=A0A9X0C079_9EURO|nr:uncharacterized protein N7539_001924 [Penicillium diatomitis]KAJ5493178.1 hypothetical protein N7539_001924 [Penicillium diatomitis]